MKENKLGFFEQYLSIWVILCMIIGVLIGQYLPFIPNYLRNFEYANVSIPIAILIWLMIYPMMIKVDFKSIKQMRRNPQGLILTWIINWLIKPFTMFAIAWFFFFIVFKNIMPSDLGMNYLQGAVLLGAAPCTAMVFVWSYLTKGDPTYTVVQVATNDLIILFAFAPIVGFLLEITGVSIPWDTLFISIILFVVIPLVFGILSRIIVVSKKGINYFENNFVNKFNNITVIGLLLTLIIIFSFQGQVIINNPIHILLISIPLIIQTVFIFALTYFTAYKLKLPHQIAAVSGMIGASNFFELAVAMAIILFKADSPVVLATIVGVLVEVPIMLILVYLTNKTRRLFND